MFSYSNFGNKFSKDSGINILMQDLSEALNSGKKNLLFLGGGNPALIPEAIKIYHQEILSLFQEQQATQHILGIYDNPQGSEQFREIAANYYSEKFNCKITEKNILLTNGSQSSFFNILNFFSGKSAKETQRILLPLVPEYIGYADATIEENIFSSYLPLIEKVESSEYSLSQFRYSIDFNSIDWQKPWGLALHSRPSNPTSMVMPQQDFNLLIKKCKNNNIPLMVDQAYGGPIPNLVYTNNTLSFTEEMIISMSFSKVGLPGLRTGVIIANEILVKDLAKSISVMNLATSSIGPALIQKLLEKNKFDYLCSNHIKPFYEGRVDKALQIFNQYAEVLSDVYFHQCDGAFFFWIWVDRKDFDCEEYYQRLKRQNCFIVPGHYFFYGLTSTQQKNFSHSRQCFRINIAQSDEVLEQSIELIVKNLNS